MKKKNLICGSGIKMAILSAFALFTFTSCSAYPSNAGILTTQSQALTDSVMRTAVGDSIYRIITEAKKIKAEEIKMTNDTTKTTISTATNVKSKQVSLVQFILSDPKNYGGDMPVYGQFMPCFKLTFIKKKESCILNFDFGLKKWNLCNSDGKEIKRYDLPSDDMLRLANMLFPNNDLYKKQINTVQK